jgi:hypothetical protein
MTCILEILNINIKSLFWIFGKAGGLTFLKFLVFLKKIFFIFLDCFDVLISRIYFKKIKKYIILMYFRGKSILKNNRYHVF